MSRLTYRPRFGPGSIVMVVGLVAFGLYGYLSQPGPVKTSYFEADASGNLKLVDRPSISKKRPLVPLSRLKPEPALILEHASQLELEPAQREVLGNLQSTWLDRKAAFQRSIEREQKTAESTSGERSSVPNINRDLAEYSRLSVEYDLERQALWNRSLNVLDPSQRLRIERYLAGGKL